MHIRYAQHARTRMRQRGISPQDVTECLQNSMSRFETSKKTQYRALVNGRILKVGVAPDVDTATEKLVTTVMWEGEDD